MQPCVGQSLASAVFVLCIRFVFVYSITASAWVGPGYYRHGITNEP